MDKNKDSILFDTIKYVDINSFKDVLTSLDKEFPSYNADKLHLNYFESYFTELGVKTILIEFNYIDRDYLEDFAAYYVRCFSDYKRKCTRLHFFKNNFSLDDFKNLLFNPEPSVLKDILQDNYLGFIVIKPLPKTIFGRTCLITYPPLARRHFPLMRDYPVNLFGISLKIQNTIAYQEQDSIVAACASTAIWSAFQVTGMLFQHSIPSPVEITKSATNFIPSSSRIFPNKGLVGHQMTHAIRNVGLDPFIINANKYFFLKNAVYAYLNAGIPLILALEFQYFNNNKYDSNYPNKLLHAVTVTGYSLGNVDTNDLDRKNFFTIASKIDKIYVHDDQVGPYAKMECNAQTNLSFPPKFFKLLFYL